MFDIDVLTFLELIIELLCLIKVIGLLYDKEIYVKISTLRH